MSYGPFRVSVRVVSVCARLHHRGISSIEARVFPVFLPGSIP